MSKILFDRLKNEKEFVNISKFIVNHLKYLRKPHQREAVKEWKQTLTKLVASGDLDIRNDAHLKLNTISSQQPLSANGNALPTKYTDFNGIPVYAKLSDKYLAEHSEPKTESAPVVVASNSTPPEITVKPTAPSIPVVPVSEVKARVTGLPKEPEVNVAIEPISENHVQDKTSSEVEIVVEPEPEPIEQVQWFPEVESTEAVNS